MRGAALGPLLLLAGALSAATAGEEPYGLPIEGEAAERFLLAGEVVAGEPLTTGVTQSERLTLSDGSLTARAVWKVIDERKPIMEFSDGTREIGFQDSYRCELAAYELDKLLGLGMVPPTVERRLDDRPGSLQLWVEGAMMEAERVKKGVSPPDLEHWSEQIYRVRLFHNLIFNTDYNNISNILIDPQGRIYLIDHSRSFRVTRKLQTESDLKRFSRTLLERLRALDRPLLEERLGAWLTKKQIEGLLARRDLILERAEELTAERGKRAVLYD